jgi:hypothetical protein
MSSAIVTTFRMARIGTRSMPMILLPAGIYLAATCSLRAARGSQARVGWEPGVGGGVHAPASRRSAEIDASARLCEELVLLVQLYQLERSTASVALRCGASTWRGSGLRAQLSHRAANQTSSDVPAPLLSGRTYPACAHTTPKLWVTAAARGSARAGCGGLDRCSCGWCRRVQRVPSFRPLLVLPAHAAAQVVRR